MHVRRSRAGRASIGGWWGSKKLVACYGRAVCVDVHCVGNAILHHAFPFITAFQGVWISSGVHCQGSCWSHRDALVADSCCRRRQQRSSRCQHHSPPLVPVPSANAARNRSLFVYNVWCTRTHACTHRLCLGSWRHCRAVVLTLISCWHGTQPLASILRSPRIFFRIALHFGPLFLNPSTLKGVHRSPRSKSLGISKSFQTYSSCRATTS